MFSLNQSAALSILYLILFYPLPVKTQLTTVVSSFNNIGGKALSRIATISENAVVGKLGVDIFAVVPGRGTQTGGSHVHVLGSGTTQRGAKRDVEC